MIPLVPITHTISMVQAPNGGRYPYAHALLVQDGSVTALVDTGCGHEILRALLDAVLIDFVICSHSHTDHTSGNWLMAGRPIWMPAGIGFETGGQARLLARRFIRDETLREDWLNGTVPYTGFKDAPLTDPYPPGHVFEIGNTRLHSIPAPGHLSDHTCFWEPESGVLLSVDIDFSSFGPWYGNPEGDVDAFEDSVRRVRALQPRTVISSHKGVYRGAEIEDAFAAYEAHFARRDARILAAVRHPTRLDDLVERAIIYGRFPRAGALLRYFEREMVSKHLQRLAKQNRAQQVTPGVWSAI